MNLLRKLAHQVLLIAMAIGWSVAIPAFLILLSPAYFWRFIVSKLTKGSKVLCKLVQARSCIMAVDNFEKPECSVVIWFALEGEVGVKEFSAMFKERVLELRRPSDNSLAYPELQQYYKNSLGFLFWAWDHNFSLSNHIKLCEEVKDWTGPITQEVLLRANEKLMSKPWPARQSPWEFLIVPQPYFEDADESKRSTLILFHLHHGMGDGYTFLKLILNHMAGETFGNFAKPRQVTPSRFAGLKAALTLPFQIPYEFAKQVYEAYDVNAWHLPQDKLTRKYYVAKMPKVPIGLVQKIKNKHHVSFTSVLLAATAGGIRRYFKEEGFKVPKVMHTFTSLPYPGHPDYKMANHLTGILGELPVGTSTSMARLRQSHRYLESIRHSTLPMINFYVSAITGALPSCFKIINQNYHASGLWGNFPGSNTQISMAGRKVTSFSYNIAPLHGRTGFAFTALSYNGFVTLDMTMDHALVKDKNQPSKIMSYIHQEFQKLNSF